MNYGRLIVWTLVLSPFLMAGEKEQRAAQIVQRAQNINATQRGCLPPYRQIVEFVIKAPGIPDVPGKFIHDFLDTTHHRIRMISETYDGSYVRNGEQAYTKNSAEFTPTMLSTVERAIPPLLIPNNEKVSRVFPLAQDQATLQCVEFKESSSVFCTNEQGQLVRYEVFGTTAVYSDFKAFGNAQMPAHMELLTKDGTRVIASVETNTALDLKPEIFQPPPSAGFKLAITPPCSGITPPRIRFAPDPEFPNRGIQGVVVLWLIVGPDGVPHDVKIARSLTPANDQEALKTITRWRFRPAECPDGPTSVQINVEMNFRKY